MIGYEYSTADHYGTCYAAKYTIISCKADPNSIRKAPPNWLTLCKHYRDELSELTVARRITTNYINTPEQKHSSYG